MKIAIANAPWYISKNKTNLYFVRAGSRWPHFEKFNSDGSICYMPYPFFMGYASSLLKNSGFEILTIDGAAELLTEHQFISKISNFNPDIILLEVSAVSITKDLEYAGKLKKITDSQIAFAGLHSEMYSPDFLQNNQVVDFVFIGEYEYNFYKLCECLKNKTDFSGLSGFLWKDKQGRINNSGRAALIENLDSLPLPDRDSMPLKNYLDLPGGISKPSAQITASRGCPYKCIFCAWPQIMYNGSSFRQRGADSIISEIKILKEKYNIKSFYFDDDTFNISSKFVDELCSKLINENFKLDWAAMCRADLMDKELLDKMKKAGMKAVKYGIESASQKLLNNMRKSLNLEKAVKMIEYTKNIGIKTHLTFCFGLPGETLQSINKTAELAIRLNPDSAQFSIATPFPGSALFEHLKKENKILTFDYSLYDGYNKCVIIPDNMSAETLEKAVHNAIKKINKSKKINSIISKLHRFFDSFF